MDKNKEGNILAEERDLKFKLWLQNKALKDKAFEYVNKLDASRGESKESVINLAVSLLAIEKLIPPAPLLKDEDDNNYNKSKEKTSTKVPPRTLKNSLVKDPPVSTREEEKKDKAKQKTLKDSWVKFVTEHHTFDNVVLSDKDLAELSGGTKENLKSQAELTAYDEPSVDNSESKREPASKVQNIILSLIYSFPAVPKPKEKAKPLNDDQRILNRVFMSKCRELWKEANDSLELQISDYISKNSIVESERKQKTSGDKFTPRSRALEVSCLNELGLKKLKLWLEQDEDKRQGKIDEDNKSKKDEIKKAHSSWVELKDKLRIRMPDNYTPPTQSTFNHGREYSGVRPAVKGNSNLTTVDLMAGSGLKYVHATFKGDAGSAEHSEDLKKSKNKLLKMGIIHKSNFNEDEMDIYEKERDSNTTKKEKSESEQKLKEENSKAYDEWVTLKDLKEKTVKCLALIPKPYFSNGKPSSIFEIADSKQADKCIEIGKELKKIDRTLFSEWSQWADNVLTANLAVVLWDFFAPQSCDVHCASYSQVRDSFMKLLRPGFDYQQTFIEFAEKKVINKEIEKFKDKHNYNSLVKNARDDEEKREEKEQKKKLDEEIESLRKELKSTVALSKTEMSSLLLSMGIHLKDAELNSLVDAFDANGDGVVTLNEFTEFIGPKRDRKGGSSVIINKRCCWVTTCKVTGMANGYSVSKPTKRFLKSEEEGKKEKDYKPKDSAYNTLTSETSNKVVIRELANGEKRMYVELNERRKRVDILRKFGLIDDRDLEEYSKANNEDGDDYDNDNDEFEDRDVGQKPVKETTASTTTKASCEYSKWKMEDRKDSLRFLSEETKDARGEESLKKLLASGKPPSPPNLWVEQVDVNNRDADYEEYDPCTQFTLRWSPAKNDLVSFFSIEFAGPVGSTAKSGEIKYKEIMRDPQDADPDKEFVFTYRFPDGSYDDKDMKELIPGTPYRFRIRAFNGYGPGDFTYKTFTTLTTAPIKPKIIKVASDSATIRWIFSKGFFRRIAELKKIFNLADKDISGTVNREELTAILDEKVSSYPELRSFLSKASISLGLDLSQGYGALFDAIEGDDNGVLSYEEFETFFLSIGWANNNNTNASTSSSLRASLMGGTGPLTSKVTIKPGDVVYVVEKCENEFSEIYKEVLRTSSGQATLHRLEPGKSYRFRLYSINADNVPGPKSEDIIIHTLLETPPPPSINPKNIFSDKVILTWKPRNHNASTKDKAFVDKMLGDWAGTHNENDGGVSIEAAFAKYDEDGSGTIDAGELAVMFADLGIEVTEEKLGDAFDQLDSNHDHSISFDEFAKWWRRDEVIYTVKRSEIIDHLPVSKALHEPNSARSVSRGRGGTTNQDAQSKGVTRRPLSGNNVTTSTTKKPSRQVGVPIVSYRDVKPRCEIAGLVPNRLYHFRLRFVGSRSVSLLSSPLVLMTVPLPPSMPITIDISSSSVRIKWYPSQYGADKFAVHLKQVGIGNGSSSFPANDGGRKLTSSIVGIDTGDNGWMSVYSGIENSWGGTNLASGTKYYVRVISVNSQGNGSVPSPVVEFTTLPRNDSGDIITSKTIGTKFNIECTGDVCAGDIILITERIFLKPGVSGDNNNDQRVRSSSMYKSLSGPATSRATNKMNMSVTSIHSDYNGGGVSITADHGEFIGERTIAAYVSKDNYRSIRDSLNSKKITPRDTKKFGEFRQLWLEVVWVRSSNDNCKQYEVKVGEVLKRQQSHIEQFEVFRMKWKEEKMRKSLYDEWNCLADCFVENDC